MNRQTKLTRQTDKETDRQKDWPGRQTDKQTDQTVRQMELDKTDRPDKETDQTDRETKQKDSPDKEID